MYGVRANSPRPWTRDWRTLYELKPLLRSSDHLLIDTLHRVQQRLAQTMPSVAELGFGLRVDQSTLKMRKMTSIGNTLTTEPATRRGGTVILEGISGAVEPTIRPDLVTLKHL